MVEDNISEVFALLYQYQMRVDLIQNSAISFSVCVNNKYDRLDELLQILRSKFKVTVFENVDLYTVRHFDTEALTTIEAKKDKILLEQRAQETIQYVVEQ
jgi:aspartate kinase